MVPTPASIQADVALPRIETQVAIVGGGPVGVALSIALAQYGITSVVIERHRTPQQVPKGQNLTQRTMEHFRRWKIEDALRRARTLRADQKVVGITAYGSLTGEHHYSWFERGLVDPYYWTRNERLPQYATESVLRTHLHETPEVAALFDWTATDVSQDADGATVVIESREGGSGTVHAQYVVGCDGSRSMVRAAAGITQTLSDEERRMILLVFRSPGFEKIMRRHPDTTFVNILRPGLDGYWQFFGRVDARDSWFFHAPVARDATAESIDLHEILAQAVGEDFEFTVDHLGFWDLRFALADSYRTGRLFIAGDAAHSHPPYGGYGVNTGFEDATNLAWKLAATFHGWAGEGLLDSYDAERRPVFASTRDGFIEKSILDDRAFLAAYAPERDEEAFARAWDLRALGTPDEIRRFEPNYEGSPVVAGPIDAVPSAIGGHEHRARAGHHLAPVRSRDGSDTFAALDGQFCMLVANELDAVGFADAAAHLGIPLSVIVIDDESAQRLQSPAVLVRPDEFVAWAGDPSTVDPAEVMAIAVGSRIPAQALAGAATTEGKENSDDE